MKVVHSKSIYDYKIITKKCVTVVAFKLNKG